MNYWLVKLELEIFSINDLAKCKDQTTNWEEVRNFQARNFLRDKMKLRDKVLFYHSGSKPTALMEICTVVKEGYPDFTAFDPKDIHFDPKSSRENPIWYMVDIKLEKEFDSPVTLSKIKENPILRNMRLLQKGNRLSVMPINRNEFNEIVKLGVT